jgi:hypothetical protein
MGPNYLAFSEELLKISAPAKVSIQAAAGRIYRKLSRGSPVKIRITKDADIGGGGYFDWGKEEIGMSRKDYEVLAHELGHVQIHENVLGRLIQNLPARISHATSGLSGIPASMLMAKGSNWGILLPAALAAPTLLSEAIASVKGDSLLQEAKATKEQQGQYRKRMLRAYGTYLSLPILGTVLAGGLALSRKAL